MKYYSLGFTFIPGCMLGIEFPEYEDNDFTLLIDLLIFRVIYEKWTEN